MHLWPHASGIASTHMSKNKISQQEEEETIENMRESGIIVNDSTFSAQSLPLIVVLPEGASEAQVERAKILNAYAYSNPKGWASRKWHLIAELEALKDAPAPKEDPNAPRLSV